MFSLFVVAMFFGEVEGLAFDAPNEELREYLIEAAENSPTLKSRYEEWQAALQRIPQATALDDPMLSWNQFLQSDDKRFAVALEQKFPWFGTLRARGDKAAADADVARARLYVARNELFGAVKKAYFNYGFLKQQIDLLNAQLRILSDMEQLVRERYALGLAAEAEVLRAQIEQDQLKDQIRGIEQSAPSMGAALTELLGRRNAAQPEWPLAAELPPEPPDWDIVMAGIQANNPELESMRKAVESREKDITLARKRGYPEMSVGLQYEDMKPMSESMKLRDTLMAAEMGRMLLEEVPMRGLVPATADAALGMAKDLSMQESESAEDEVMLMMQFSLPIWRKKIKAGVREAEHMEKAAQFDAERTSLSLETTAKTALYNMQDARRRLNLYNETLLPRAQDTLESFRSAYSTGSTADFVDVLDSARQLLSFQIEQARAARDLQNAYADLQQVLGRQ